MENEKISEKERILEDRVFKLEKDLINALKQVSYLEIELVSLRKIDLKSINFHIEVAEDKIEAISEALRDLIDDLIDTEVERKRKIELQRKVRIVRRQNLFKDSHEDI